MPWSIRERLDLSGIERMKGKFLVDSVIIIDHLLGIDAATQWIAELKPGEAFITPITRAEVLAGVKDEHEETGVYLLLEQFNCLEINAKVADRAAKIRKKAGLKLPDAFQAALAEEWELKLVTRNTKDFRPNKFPFILTPYKV